MWRKETLFAVLLLAQGLLSLIFIATDHGRKGKEEGEKRIIVARLLQPRKIAGAEA